MKKSTLILLTTTAIFFTSTLVLLYLNYLKPVKTSTPTTGIIPTNAPIPTVDLTAEWKTFENNNYSYSFKYPSTWNIVDLTQGKIIEIFFKTNETDSVGSLMIEKITNAPADISLYKETKIIGNYPNAKCSPELNGKSYCYLAMGDKLMILIHKYPEDSEYNKTLDQILSTFKFTDQRTSWKTYSNSKYNFSFQYDNSKHLLETSKVGEEAISSYYKYYGLNVDSDLPVLWKELRAIPIPEESKTMHFNPGQFFSVEIFNNNLTPEEFTKRLCEPEYGPDYLKNSGFKKISTKGQTFYYFNSGGIGEGTFHHVFFGKDSIISFITSESSTTYETNPEFAQILSTFKFTSSTQSLVSPDHKSPVAGICFEVTSEEEVAIVISSDNVPIPRCTKVSSNQKLKIINNSSSSIEINQTTPKTVIKSGKIFRFPSTLGEILAPGLHTIAGAEIWLQ